jgi:hypothetical protein
VAKVDPRLDSIPIDLRFSRGLLDERDALPTRRGWLAWLASALGDATELYGYEAIVYLYSDH